MTKLKTRRYMTYPKEQGLRVGIKVAWRYYDSKEDAEKASKAANHNAAIQWEQGYDFGYQVPGSIRLVPTDAKENAGRYEVCIP